MGRVLDSLFSSLCSGASRPRRSFERYWSLRWRRAPSEDRTVRLRPFSTRHFKVAGFMLSRAVVKRLVKRLVTIGWRSILGGGEFER